MSCGLTFLYLQKKIKNSWYYAFVPARCKSWSCPKCRPIKANVVRNYIKDNFKSDNLYMLTLTFFHSGDPLETWRNLGKCWNLMRTYIAKRYNAFSYLRIVEPHKEGGWPHLHVLVDGFVCDREVVKMVTKWGFGWNMHNQRISTAHAARYVSKYLTKEWPGVEADIMRIASKTRIVSVSRGMPPIFTAKSEWEVVRYQCPPEHARFMCNAIIKLLKDMGATVVDSEPFADGFIIQSDVFLSGAWLEERFDPYVWEVCDDYRFSYLPYGLQQELEL